MKKNKININLIKLGIISLIVGILYIFIGIYIWQVYLEDAAVAMIIEGAIFECMSFGLFTKHILPNKKWTFVLGFFLGVIGIIIAACIKHSESKNSKYDGNKYEDLEKLQKLKEQGVITKEEFEIEKAKILK